jgi:hypothetical protein
MPDYDASFPKGTLAQVADRATLENHKLTWKYFYPLQDEQLAFAEKIGEVVWLGYYHGGDPLYQLEGIPGVWHEDCLRAPEPRGSER